MPSPADADTVASSAEKFLHERLQSAFSPLELEILDESHLHAGHAGASPSGRGSHFRVRIVAQDFHKVPRVERHRRIYQALRPAERDAVLGCGIHALALTALSPDEAAAG